MITDRQKYEFFVSRYCASRKVGLLLFRAVKIPANKFHKLPNILISTQRDSCGGFIYDQNVTGALSYGRLGYGKRSNGTYSVFHVPSRLSILTVGRAGTARKCTWLLAEENSGVLFPPCEENSQLWWRDLMSPSELSLISKVHKLALLSEEK